MKTTLITVMPEDKRKEKMERTYSNETFYTDSSEDFRSKCKSAANLLHKRRQLRPLLGTGVGSPYRAASNYGARFVSLNSPSKTNMNGYSQKIVSAKLLRVKQLQNELTDAQFQLNELSTENKLLKTLQKRQDLALSKYEDTKAELPQLIRSHNEDVRILRAKVKQLKLQCREKDHRIKELDADLQTLRDQHHHLLKLSRNRNLGGREQLAKQVDELKEIIKDQDDRIQTLNRKVMLETKNYKHQLTTEMARHKETQRDLSESLDRISKLEILVETKEKYIATFVPKRNFRNNNRQSVSLVSLMGPSRYPDLHVSMKSEAELIPRLEEESSEGTYMASHTKTSYGSIHPSAEEVKITSENQIPSDGYNARRMKLANKRKVMMDRKLHETNINKTNDLVSSSSPTSPTPSSSSVMNDDRETDLMDDNGSKQHYSFGTAYSSRKSSLNTEPGRKFSLQDESEATGNVSVNDRKILRSEDLMKSERSESLDEENEDSNNCTKTIRKGSFQENGRKGVFTNLMADIKKENGVGKDLPLSVELQSVENDLKETMLVKCRRGSLVKENINYDQEESSLSAITNRSFSRRGSLVKEKKKLIEEESMPTISNVNSSRKGSLKREKRTFVGEESIPIITNTSSNRKGSLVREKRNFFEDESIPAITNKSRSRRESLNYEKNVDAESVKDIASNITEKASVPADEDGTKNDAPSEYRFAEASERLSEISNTWNRIQNTILTERETTEAKLKKIVSEAGSKGVENKNYEKEKLLAALKAIDDGKDLAGDKNSSILDGLLINPTPGPGSSSNMSLPFIGRMTVLDQQWEGKVISKEESAGVDRPKTKTELMQELFGCRPEDLTTRSNNNT